MALLSQTANIQLATILPEEVPFSEQKMVENELQLGKSNEIRTFSNTESVIYVPEEEPTGNEGDTTECVSDPVPTIIDEGDSTVNVTDSESINNVEVSAPVSSELINNGEDATLTFTQNTINPTMGQVPGNINVFGYSNYVTTNIPGVQTVDPMGMNAVPQAFHSVYVQYTSGAVPQTIYPSNEIPYPMYVVGSAGPVCAPPPNPFFFDNSSSTVCNAVANIPPPDPEPRQPWTCEAAPLPVPDLDPEPDPDPDADQEAKDMITAQRLGRQSTVQWLLQNYETAEGESLRRSTLYNHYLRHCREQNIDSVNAASFGKLIRSVFLGLRTRRLGTRGNSKYHYYGIRIKPSSRLNYVADYEISTPPQSTIIHQQSQQPKAVSQDCNTFLSNLDQCNIDSNTEDYLDRDIPAPLRYPIHYEDIDSNAEMIPEFPIVDWPPECTLPLCCNLEDIDLLYDTYRKHCEELRDAAVHLDFRTIEGVWRNFWKIRDYVNEKSSNKKRLSAIKMYVLSTCDPVQQFIKCADYIFYQHLVDVIVPDVLRPMPKTLIRSVRNFSDGLASLLKSLLLAWPEELIKIKVSAVNAFSRTLYRYTSLNHIAQSVSATILDQSNLEQMMSDLCKVDFRDIQERAFWVFRGESETLHQFNVTIQNQPPKSMDECTNNLTNFVTRILKPYEGRSDFEKLARQFLLQWSYYSSLFMAYLTLKNAGSFGSYHLVRLLSDEYVFYLVVHYVARETGKTPVAIIGEKYGEVLCGLGEHTSLDETYESCVTNPEL